jgi:heme/copper-type cytochrome/quinol oxidase subunit 1
MSGRLYDEGLGRLSFWLVFVGFNLAFFPMHLSGLLGMPRRVYTYPAGMGWDLLNLVSTIGAFVLALGILVVAVNVVVSLGRGLPAGPDPWNGGTLEWATSSPPPPYNFARIPVVRSSMPLWDDGSAASDLVLPEGHSTPATTPLDADPAVVLRMPHDSLAPIGLSIGLAVICIGLVASLYWLAVLGAVATLVVAAFWHHPREGSPVDPPP